MSRMRARPCRRASTSRWPRTGRAGWSKARQRRVQRQQDRQVEIVLPLGQRLDAQAGAVEDGIGHRVRVLWSGFNLTTGQVKPDLRSRREERAGTLRGESAGLSGEFHGFQINDFSSGTRILSADPPSEVQP